MMELNSCVIAGETAPGTVFMLVTGVPAIDTAIDAVNFGATRYVIKGDRLLDELRPAVRQSGRTLCAKGSINARLRRLTGLDHIIGTSPKMRAIFDLIQNGKPRWS